MTALKLKDSAVVIVLSTVYTSENIPNKDQVKPKCIVKYDKYMGGVDRTDQMIAHAKACLKVLKWWKKVFFHILTLTCLNSYLMYKGNVTIPMSNRQFRKRLIENMVALDHQLDINTMPVVGRPSTCNLDRLTGRQFLKRLSGKPRRCVVCNPARRQMLSSSGKPSTKRPGHESKYHCPRCNVVLCIEPCHEIYHTNQNYILAYKRQHSEE